MLGTSLMTSGNTPHGTLVRLTRAVRFLVSATTWRWPETWIETRLTPWNRRGSGPRIALLRVFTHGFAIGGDTLTGIVMTVLTPLTVIVN